MCTNLMWTDLERVWPIWNRARFVLAPRVGCAGPKHQHPTCIFTAAGRVLRLDFLIVIETVWQAFRNGSVSLGKLPRWWCLRVSGDLWLNRRTWFGFLLLATVASWALPLTSFQDVGNRVEVFRTGTGAL